MAEETEHRRPESESEAVDERLLEAARAFVADLDHPLVSAFFEPFAGATPEHVAVELASHPAIAHREELRALSNPLTKPFTDTVLDLAEAMRWQVSYSLADGFDQFYIDNYAWSDLIGPKGPFLSEDRRIGFGYWRKGLHYPRHAHEPEELYVILAGHGVFTIGEDAPVTKGPGAVVHLPPWVAHGIDMEREPVLVFFLWRGAALHRRSRFDRD